MEGPDHKASLEPHELRAMVCAIHNIEQAMGDGVKRPSASERRNIGIVRKSIVAKRDISEGEILSEENITTKPSRHRNKSHDVGEGNRTERA